MQPYYDVKRGIGGWQLDLVSETGKSDGGWFPDDPTDEFETMESYCQASKAGSKWFNEQPDDWINEMIDKLEEEHLKPKQV
ncbi:hypothetical protein [Pseudomonas sp. PS02302]|uniref:hypothetical protein n=1 Tax=Pseudomonas sp. PS02302 TaxID=2991428 RepID=UPI00249B52F1|nr:hypothetical protein [Pseudomonas sp. PS02302]